MVSRNRWREKNVEITNRVVIQGSYTSELSVRKEKMLAKIPIICFYPGSTELESLRARPS